MEKMIVTIIALSIAIFVSCQTIQQELDPKIYYKRDMIITIDANRGEGILVAPKATEYNIEVEAKGNLDLLTVSTCHKEISIERAWDKGLFKSKRKVTFKYIPVPEFETKGSCVLQLGGYESGKGRHSWAMIDFENDEFTLPATIKCNGQSYISRGTSICQTKKGLIEGIDFATPVIISPDPACPMPEPIDKMTFRFNIVGRECVYMFTEVNKPHKSHKLTTIGFEEQSIREGE